MAAAFHTTKQDLDKLELLPTRAMEAHAKNTCFPHLKTSLTSIQCDYPATLPARSAASGGVEAMSMQCTNDGATFRHKDGHGTCQLVFKHMR
jgi:hypothetical protein